jgi:cbb3-type cytochrome oxidase cytochrome c subunit
MTVLLGVLFFAAALAVVAVIILVGIAASVEVLPPLFARRTEEDGDGKQSAALPLASHRARLAGRSAARFNL